MHPKSRERDKSIIELITQKGAVDRAMVEMAYFGCTRRAQAVLTRLTKERKLNRVRDEQYVYYVGHRPADWQHTLLINRFEFELRRQLKSWMKIVKMIMPKNYCHGWADGFFEVKNTVNDHIRKYYLEADTGKHSDFDKVIRYGRAYDEWLEDEPFPAIVVMTTRPEMVNRQIEKHNKEGLLWKVCTLEDVRKDIWKVIL